MSHHLKTISMNAERDKNMANIKDVFVTVEVPKIEYEELIRESEQLKAVKRMLQKDSYVSTDDLRAIVNVSKEKEEGAE